jgi:hypothetical protein
MIVARINYPDFLKVPVNLWVMPPYKPDNPTESNPFHKLRVEVIRVKPSLDFCRQFNIR